MAAEGVVEQKGLKQDALAALGLMIAFYYGITGFACAIYYRRELTNGLKNFRRKRETAEPGTREAPPPMRAAEAAGIA